MTFRNYSDCTAMGQQFLYFFKIPLAPSAIVFPNNLALSLKDLKALLSLVLASKLVASYLE